MKNAINKRLPLTLVAAAVLMLNAAAQITAKPGRANGDTLEIDRLSMKVVKIMDENGNDIKRITRKLNPIERE